MLEDRERATAAAVRYLEHMGYEVVGRAYCPGFHSCDIVAREEASGDLHFIMVGHVTHGQEHFAKLEHWGTRPDFEGLVACWLEDHPDDTNVRVVPDCVSFLLVGSDRALLRHYVGVPLDEPPGDE